MIDKINNLTRLLCATCNMLEKRGISFPDIEVLEWWEKHQQNPGHEK